MGIINATTNLSRQGGHRVRVARKGRGATWQRSWLKWGPHLFQRGGLPQTSLSRYAHTQTSLDTEPLA